MNVKQLRKSLKLNTKDFGELVGVTGRAVESWEQGLRNTSKSAKMMIAYIKMPKHTFSQEQH